MKCSPIDKTEKIIKDHLNPQITKKEKQQVKQVEGCNLS